MANITIRRIGAENKGDACLPNEPFELWGRMIPHLEDGKWSYTTEEFAERTQMCFPDEPYDPETSSSIFLGAYEQDRCIGLAVLSRDSFKYLYLDDLKVSQAARSKGVGQLLINACMQEAEKQGLLGVYTIGQDNNLSACLFYISQGFEIGGFDNRIYRATPQEDKANIIFYKDLPKTHTN